MIDLPDKVSSAYSHFMAQQKVPFNQQAYYNKWLRYYIDFCKKYHHPYAAPESLSDFIVKLKSKGQSNRLLKNSLHTTC